MGLIRALGDRYIDRAHDELITPSHLGPRDEPLKIPGRATAAAATRGLGETDLVTRTEELGERHATA